METNDFRKILCANRGEIAIRVFRACTELGKRTVAVFSTEDRSSQHRLKADEAYLIGRSQSPIGAYLDVAEILDCAQRTGAEAIHPGYGFLSENAEFAKACEARGIAFIGPRPEVVRLLGDKIQARQIAEQAGVPVVPGLTLDVSQSAARDRARAFFAKHAPIVVKAAHGGGGRGMRVVQPGEDLDHAIAAASSEALSAFGSAIVFLERFLRHVRHVEVQILGDLRGNLVHLHERDCSVQRRHQKVVEVAPAYRLDEVIRKRLHADALAIASAVSYTNAGTVEFLVEGDQHYFIEVNPRLQVEHTVTEQVTGIDLVQAQIRIAEGYSIHSDEIGIYEQSRTTPRGYAIQCRITTEDPASDFMPDTGTITAFRSAAGFGIRLDTGNGYPGATISRHYDSLLVKMTTYAPTYQQAIMKGIRALREFRIRGVKTNLPFLESVLQHPAFQSGEVVTNFIDQTPELVGKDWRRDRATKILGYIADVIVNGHRTVPADQRLRPTKLAAAPIPPTPSSPPTAGSAQLLEQRGATGLAQWVLAQHRPLLCDTTMRDAHQSLLATRVRTYDIARIARATAHLGAQLFSLETWGGATFDVAYRFLNEDPWDRLRKLKRAAPNLLQQMLLRGANAVGYTSYPDNLVEAFVDEAALTGVDIFRVFDSLNDVDNMRVAVDRIRKTPKVAEVAMCYTGDVANPQRTKYDLDYYRELARRIEDLGAHILCIKDMAGLLRPQAARSLVSCLKQTVSIPIHLHTHDTSGNGIATLLEAIDVGIDIVDVALAPMAGMTSQPSMNALVAALRGNPRESGLANKDLQPLADYWEVVRDYYQPFECGLKSSTSEVYYHEIPGGQYSNLRPQVASLGLLNRWQDVKHAFAVVNQLVGDIPKVTPSSKMVGDFAVFLVQNDLLDMADTLTESVDRTRNRLLGAAPRLDFPVSVVTYFQGGLGTPPGGFPAELRAAVLRGQPTSAGQPSADLPVDLDQLAADLTEKTGQPIGPDVAISHALYPRVIDEHLDFIGRHGDVSILDTPTYFYGLEIGQEVWIELEPGKTLIVALDAVGEIDDDGNRQVYFRLNGQARSVSVRDNARAPAESFSRKADPGNPSHVGAPMPGIVIGVHCEAGAAVEEGDPLLTLEAMKMETIVRAPCDGTIDELVPAVKASVDTEDLLVVLG